MTGTSSVWSVPLRWWPRPPGPMLRLPRLPLPAPRRLPHLCRRRPVQRRPRSSRPSQQPRRPNPRRSPRPPPATSPTHRRSRAQDRADYRCLRSASGRRRGARPVRRHAQARLPLRQPDQWLNTALSRHGAKKRVPVPPIVADSGTRGSYPPRPAAAHKFANHSGIMPKPRTMTAATSIASCSAPERSGTVAGRVGAGRKYIAVITRR